jgi:methylated-DNA-[protein]-cysteine S-methyltransferase
MRRQKAWMKPRPFCAYYNSPIGTIEIVGTEDGVTSVSFGGKRSETPAPAGAPPPVEMALRQLDEYFRGKREKFTVKLVVQGTEFQKKVWRQLIGIPFGGTVSYGEVAVAIGRPKATRAVGSANGLNKINIIIPCHRVIGRNGGLVGYGGGLWRKRWLIAHERKSKEGRASR